MKRLAAVLLAAGALALGVAAAAPVHPEPQACAFCWPTNR